MDGLKPAMFTMTFDGHPDPMWIYDLQTLRFVEVNEAATLKYGYSRQEFLAMTLKDIRPEEDVPALLQNIREAPSGFDRAGVWRHRLKDGREIHVDIVSQTVDYRGVPAKLVCARDVTRLVDVVLRSQELRAANSALLEQQAKLRTVQRLLGVGIWKLDVDSGVLTWSDNIYALYGVDQQTFGRTFDDYVRLVHPDDRDQMMSNYLAFEASDEGNFDFSHRIVRPAGGMIDVRGIGERIRGPDGKCYLTGTVQDITAQKQAESRIRESAMLLRMAGRVARLGAWRVILEPEEVVWSAETAAIHGEPEDFRPTVDDTINYYAPEYRERMREAFSACATDAQPFDELLQIVTARGNRIWVHSIGEPEYGDDGRVCAVRGALQDVSELIEAQQQAQRLSDRLRETLESISDAFFTLDRDWRFVFLNGHAERLVERSRNTLVGRNIWAEFPEAVGTSFQQQYEAAVNDRRTVRFTEWYPPLQRWFEVHAYPTGDGLAVYFRDVSEQRDLEDRLRQSQKLEAIGQLTGGLAHDFNNLLTVILGSAKTLVAQLADQTGPRAFADMIVTAAESGAALTNRLLGFARRQAPEPQRVDLNELMDRMHGLLCLTLGEAVEIEQVAPEGLWITELDPCQMENALLNLALNSRDAMPGGGRLTIATANASLEAKDAAGQRNVPPGQYVVIAVSDTGTGMPSEVVERVFDPFFSTKGDGQGSGLGLSMVYGFVKQARGHVRVLSKVGHGTTVELYFPRAPDKRESPPPIGH